MLQARMRLHRRKHEEADRLALCSPARVGGGDGWGDQDLQAQACRKAPVSNARRAARIGGTGCPFKVTSLDKPGAVAACQEVMPTCGRATDRVG